mmetsp:Transcript_50182/g.60560  ORF Transcript_50182/g.60560 Transcript_50182/m.60560 type:complete len:278 (+) Transcript_50182:116-949(+)|eukprot:CAMPEP_0172518098 /NCGR_PEP_ID=MMETSP1066-20121228/290417_1 /TAXON_ID=671091 /ORGANISM="Coscinodiscus wailesii, Strain CCMP2513" /LENGTH=277 /DNA_ID=CAMNT_0013300407 /DNA_START=138 /DNA_END=971 /DNA_ORIENTATION=+
MAGDQNDHSEGCCSRLMKCLVKMIFLIDVVAGITVLAYAGYVMSKAPIVAADILISFGSILVLSSILGIWGFAMTACNSNRCALVLSAILALFLGLFEISFAVFMVARVDLFINYLLENKDALRLSEGGIQSIQLHTPLIAIGLIVIGIVEMMRFCMMTNVRKRLIEFDTLHSTDEALSTSLIPKDTRIIPEESAIDTHSLESERDREERWSKMLGEVDDGTIGSKDSPSITSQDDFAPVDEPLYTDSHWWAKSNKDTVNDMSWVTTAKQKQTKPMV